MTHCTLPHHSPLPRSNCPFQLIYLLSFFFNRYKLQLLLYLFHFHTSKLLLLSILTHSSSQKTWLLCSLVVFKPDVSLKCLGCAVGHTIWLSLSHSWDFEVLEAWNDAFDSSFIQEVLLVHDILLEYLHFVSRHSFLETREGLSEFEILTVDFGIVLSCKHVLDRLTHLSSILCLLYTINNKMI